MQTPLAEEKFRMAACTVCNQPTKINTGRGRPAIYCSPGCRRYRELELRRASEAVDRLELRLEKRRVTRAAYPPPNPAYRGRPDAETVALENELAKADARLKALLVGAR
jgi:hypothetical protein